MPPSYDAGGSRPSLYYARLSKEAVPSLKSVVILTHQASAVNALALKEAPIAARRLGLEARVIEVRDTNELEPVFTMIARERTRGVVLVPSSVLWVHRIQIAELATKRGLPVVGWTSTLTKSGILLSY